MLIFLYSIYLDTGIKADFITYYGFDFTLNFNRTIGFENNLFVFSLYDDTTNNLYIVMEELRLKLSFFAEKRVYPYLGTGGGFYMDRDTTYYKYHLLILGLHIHIWRTSGEESPWRGLYIEPELTAGLYKDYKGVAAGIGIGYRW